LRRREDLENYSAKPPVLLHPLIKEFAYFRMSRAPKNNTITRVNSTAINAIAL
jgi:hypothetical protein